MRKYLDSWKAGFRNYGLPRTFFGALFILLLSASEALAYVGPGAGFALISSFFILIVAGLIAFFTIISWPVRGLILYLSRRKIRKNTKVKRAIVIGFDGFDPDLCKQYMDEDKLPNLKHLAEKGCFCPLETTTPAISPVAWSSFATGVNPGKHNIFDFFTRDPKTYLPVLSSAHITLLKKKLAIGPIKIPISKPIVKLLRKSTSFWTILGKNKIFSSVIRVPITFPPEKFYGTCLSAMCAPDLLGTQGSFTYFTSDKAAAAELSSKGNWVAFDINENEFATAIYGPVMNVKGENVKLRIPVAGKIDPNRNQVCLTIDKTDIWLKETEYSNWITLTFRVGGRKQIRGVVKFLVTRLTPHLNIYMTPINIDPEKPNLPISHPFYYSIGISKLFGSFSTLGLAEDTWALNEGVIDETAFLQQAYDIYEERKILLMDYLKRTKEGFFVIVFDTTDRIQHMFFRHLDADHPANRDKDNVKHKKAVEDLYMRMDQLVGEVKTHIKKDDLLMIMSDHGFKPFKWGVNLNSWLWLEGYLVLKENASPAAIDEKSSQSASEHRLEQSNEWFSNVDWTQTRAFAYGLAGIFINTKGREHLGIVKPGEEKKVLQLEIKEKLQNLFDASTNKKPIRRVLLSQNVLQGPYVNEAPDLMIGYEVGYRASWNCATGVVTENVIEENTKNWSGDHAIDPELVPGVFFSNWQLENESPSIQDLAPTILHNFGIPKPKFQDGRVLNLYSAKQV